VRPIAKSLTLLLLLLPQPPAAAAAAAGLAPGEAEALDKLDPRWQVNGKFGVLQFAQP
jgi:hypothetical protein